jgi:DNA (cytosine-5)-methyltransferase 1
MHFSPNLHAVSLFAGGGIGESRLDEIGIKVLTANELVTDRVDLFRQLNPKTNVVAGDIRDEKIAGQVLDVNIEIDILIFVSSSTSVK